MKFFQNKKKLTDIELVELSKRNQKHFGELYERYFDTIFRFIFKRLGGNEELASDLTQQTFIKAMGNIFKYEDRGLPFSSWLFRIAQNEVNLYFRSSKKETAIELSEKQVNSIIETAEISNSISEETQETLIKKLQELNQDHLDLIELRFFQELSFKEIAEIYDITEANAKMKIYRILEKIKLNWSSEK